MKEGSLYIPYIMGAFIFLCAILVRIRLDQGAQPLLDEKQRSQVSFQISREAEKACFIIFILVLAILALLNMFVFYPYAEAWKLLLLSEVFAVGIYFNLMEIRYLNRQKLPAAYIRKSSQGRWVMVIGCMACILFWFGYITYQLAYMPPDPVSP